VVWRAYREQSGGIEPGGFEPTGFDPKDDLAALFAGVEKMLTE